VFQSALVNGSSRIEYLWELMNCMEIHSYGRLLNNRSLEIPDRGQETKLEVIRSYKFCLGFENSVCPDYVTEKFFEPFLAGTVPVYRGAPNVEDFAPGPHSFINADDFAGPRELAEYLTYLDHDDAAYEAYFAWREQGLSPQFKALLARRSDEPFCKLAELVAGLPTARPRAGWWERMTARRIRLT
jgi:alpha-1,3-fucosyltransferase 10